VARWARIEAAQQVSAFAERELDLYGEVDKSLGTSFERNFRARPKVKITAERPDNSHRLLCPFYARHGLPVHHGCKRSRTLGICLIP